MKKYAVIPFITGKVFFATQDSFPNFQIDITTQESIVFFESDFYACYMVHKSVKDKLIKEGLKGFHFPKTELCQMEYSFKNKENFKKDKPLPKWEWIVFSEVDDPNNNVYVNPEGEIICDDQFLDVLRTRSLNEERTIIKNIETKKSIESTEVKSSTNIYQQDKSFNPIMFAIILFIAVLVGIILFA